MSKEYAENPGQSTSKMEVEGNDQNVQVATPERYYGAFWGQLWGVSPWYHPCRNSPKAPLYEVGSRLSQTNVPRFCQVEKPTFQSVEFEPE